MPTAVPHRTVAPAPPQEVTQFLLDVTPVEEGSFEGARSVNYRPGAHSINGQTFVHSVAFGLRGPFTPPAPEEVQWNLERRCRTLIFTAGITDDSSEIGVADFTVEVDGGTRWERNLGFGRGVTATINVSGALRLKLNVVSTASKDEDFYAAWGNARVTCNAPLPTD